MHLLTPATAEPVNMAEAKAAARIDDTRFDGLIPGYISAARQMAEQETGRSFTRQTWRVELPDWPAPGAMFDVYQPSAVAASYWNGTAWAAYTGLAWWAVGLQVEVAPALGGALPALGAVAGGPRVRLDITAGPAPDQMATVPDCVKTYIKAIVITLLDNPGLSTQGAAEVSPHLARLLDSQRLWL